MCLVSTADRCGLVALRKLSHLYTLRGEDGKLSEKSKDSVVCAWTAIGMYGGV